MLTGATILTAGVVAGLRATGWSTETCPDPPSAQVPTGAPGEGLVVVADDQGRFGQPAIRHALRSGPFGRSGRAGPVGTVAVGSLTALAALTPAIEQGLVRPVDAEQSFPTVISSIHGQLTTAIDPLDARAWAGRLRQHDADRVAFARLTSREQDILAALVLGMTAGQIAADRHLSIATVRSHIRSILGQLGQTSQVAVIAMAHRTLRPPPAHVRAGRFHQY